MFGLVDAAQPGAGGAGSLWLVEGEMRHADLWHGRAAVRAGKRLFQSGIVVCASVALPVRVGDVEGRRDIFSAGRAGAVSQAGEQHTQVGVDIGGRADRGARAVVGEVLVDADGRREPVMESTGGFAMPKGDHAERFQVLALAFLVQDVEAEGGLARAGQAGQDDELVLGDREGDVFQVVQPGACER